MVTQYPHKPPNSNQKEWNKTPKKHPLLYTCNTQKAPFSHYHFHKHPLNTLTCREPVKTPINLSEGKSLCAFIFKTKPLGDLGCLWGYFFNFFKVDNF